MGFGRVSKGHKITFITLFPRLESAGASPPLGPTEGEGWPQRFLCVLGVWVCGFGVFGVQGLRASGVCANPRL